MAYVGIMYYKYGVSDNTSETKKERWIYYLLLNTSCRLSINLGWLYVVLKGSQRTKYHI